MIFGAMRAGQSHLLYMIYLKNISPFELKNIYIEQIGYTQNSSTEIIYIDMLYGLRCAQNENVGLYNDALFGKSS